MLYIIAIYIYASSRHQILKHTGVGARRALRGVVHGVGWWLEYMQDMPAIVKEFGNRRGA